MIVFKLMGLEEKFFEIVNLEGSNLRNPRAEVIFIKFQFILQGTLTGSTNLVSSW